MVLPTQGGAGESPISWGYHKAKLRVFGVLLTGRDMEVWPEQLLIGFLGGHNVEFM